MRKIVLVYSLFSFLSCCLFAASFTNLGQLIEPSNPTGVFSELYGISPDGRMLWGMTYPGFGNNGFYYSQGEGLVELGSGIEPRFILEDGSIVGRISRPDAYPKVYWDLFVWEQGKEIQVLGIENYYFNLMFAECSLGGYPSNINMIAGTVVSNHNYIFNRPFVWKAQENTFIQLYDPQDPSTATEYIQCRPFHISSDGKRVYLANDFSGNNYIWTEEKGHTPIVDAFGNTFEFYPTSVSEDEMTILGFKVVDGLRYPVRWSYEAGSEEIELPDGWKLNYIFGLNPECSIYGGNIYKDNPSYGVAFIGTEKLGIVPLDEFLNGCDGVDIDRWRLTEVSGVSSDGTTIVGNGTNPYGKNEGWIVEIPSLLVETITVVLDIKPQSCPNQLNAKSKGIFDVAILGTRDFDVRDIDLTTISLEGVSPLKCRYKDETSPVIDDQECECRFKKKDKIVDLTMKFDTEQIVDALGPVQDDQEWLLHLTGLLYDGTAIEGSDCIAIKE